MFLALCYTLLQNSNLSTSIHFSTCKILGNHYDVLNLPRNCSVKEIKESFIKLSKEYHPDVNKNKDAHKKFVQVNEAYKVLSKKESRHLYDLGFSSSHGFSHSNEIRVPYREQFGRDPWTDPSFYMNRNKAYDNTYENAHYYGIKGVKRVSNLTIVIFCLTLTTFVVGLQVLAIRNSFTFRRDNLIKKSNDAQNSLKEVRGTAALNGNEMQIELLEHKLANSAKYKNKTYFWCLLLQFI